MLATMKIEGKLITAKNEYDFALADLNKAISIQKTPPKRIYTEAMSMRRLANTVSRRQITPSPEACP